MQVPDRALTVGDLKKLLSTQPDDKLVVAVMQVQDYIDFEYKGPVLCVVDTENVIELRSSLRLVNGTRNNNS